jgi:SAM-dependent MidA family methyltransferase
MNGHIIGKEGDFTTSPELSQTFGELIGVWSLRYCLKKSRKEVSILELGPGRGTLISDALRAIKKLIGEKLTTSIYLLEKSPAFKSIQKKTLQNSKIKWLNDIGDMPKKPLVFLANEFFDALPINQYLRVESGWRERQISLKKGKLCISLDNKIINFKINYFRNVPLGGIVEYSLESMKIFLKICDHIKEFGGIALLIDYGELSGFGDTLQAVKKHIRKPFITWPGKNDLSSHVNFGLLTDVALKKGLVVSPVIEQHNFLKNLGIQERLLSLIEKNSRGKVASEIKGIERLIDAENMGKLFKVMGLSNTKDGDLEGFI